MKKSVIVIVGPTASGKTRLSILLARRVKGEIISADSRQIYRQLDIGTAKPGREERAEIQHHFIDILEPDEEYSAGRYGRETDETIGNILARGKTPILVGGSGLYVKAAIDGLFEGPERDPELRDRLEQERREEGIEGLMKKLEEVDPRTAAVMKKEPKVRRIMRALEVFYATGQPISRLHAEQPRKKAFDAMQIGITWERRTLYERVERRVDAMMEAGFLDEVKTLTRRYPHPLNALNTVGYKELRDHLDGRLTLDQAIDLVKRNTRRFAKRQLTWFTADKRILWSGVSSEDDLEEIARRIVV